MRKYKILFWISMAFLLITNLFWIYQIVDIAVGHGYYKVSCEEYNEDRERFIQIFKSMTTQKEVIEFLDIYKIEYEKLQKSEELYILLSSFDIGFDKNGNLIEFNQR